MSRTSSPIARPFSALLPRALPLAGLALLGGLAFAAAPASAQVAPAQISVTQQGENFAVDYAPGHDGNIVGGGPVIAEGRGENLSIRHVDTDYASAAPGIPVDLGGRGDVVYLAPQDSPWAMAGTADRDPAS